MDDHFRVVQVTNRLTAAVSGPRDSALFAHHASGAWPLLRNVIQHSGMDTRWHLKAFAGLTIALLCMFSEWLLGGQGYSTFQLFGCDFGFARIKSLTFFVWYGELHRFPVDGVAFVVAVASVGFAVWITRKHFRARRASA